MPKLYHLAILTPERSFFEGDVYSITVEALDGRLSVMADHIPMVAALSAGALMIRDADGERAAFHSEGFMEVTREGVVMLAQACEWPEEIDEARAVEAAKRAQYRLDVHSDMSVSRSKVALSRALTRLRVKRHAYRD